MKIFRQAQAAECGLACLAMVAGHLGYHTDLTQLRRRFPMSLKGANLARLIDIAQTLGFQARPLRLELDELDQLEVPCILHWDLNHFVVLEKSDKRGITILDPALGRRRISLSEASSHFTGVALELRAGTQFRRQAPAPAISMQQLTGRVRGLWSSLMQLLLLSLALQVFVLLAPLYMQWVVDQALVSADRELLTVLGLGFGLAVLLQVAISLLRGWTLAVLSNRLGLQWTANVFAHVLRLPLGFFETRHLGDVVSRMGAIESIRRTLTTSFIEAIIDGVMALATLTMMLIYSPSLAAITLLAVAMYLGLRALAFRPLRNATEEQLESWAKQQSHLLESLRGIQSLKVAAVEGHRQAIHQNLIVDSFNRELQLSRLNLGFNTASSLIFGIERIAVIWIGAGLAMQSVFSVGMLIAYLAYKDQFANRAAALIDKWLEFRMLRLHGERLADVVLTAPETDATGGFEVVPGGDTRIDVEGLSFRYADGEPWVIKDCSFSVADGESVAVVGASGCGKTTLIKLLLGLLPATTGTIRVGGCDIRQLGLRNYRAMVGAVMQDDQLFAGSVAENIGLGDAELDPARVEVAARLASVHDEIVSMPMGYHSLIGDMGTTLSGGQKQRVILARALYRNPRLLFLDEATSHLDVDRERVVNDAVRKLDLTKLIVAHRPETIASVDRVLVMAGGAVVREVVPARDAGSS